MMNHNKHIRKAVDFLQSLPRYKDVDVQSIMLQYDINFHNQDGRSFHYGHSKRIDIRFSQTNQNVLHFYPRKKAVYATPGKGIKVDIDFYIISTLIHELTHAIDVTITGKTGEVITTINEVEWMKTREEYFKQLIKIPDQKFKKGQRVIFNEKVYHVHKRTMQNYYDTGIMYEYILARIDNPSRGIKRVPEKLIKLDNE